MTQSHSDFNDSLDDGAPSRFALIQRSIDSQSPKGVSLVQANLLVKGIVQLLHDLLNLLLILFGLCRSIDVLCRPPSRMATRRMALAVSWSMRPSAISLSFADTFFRFAAVSSGRLSASMSYAAPVLNTFVNVGSQAVHIAS